MTAYRTASRLFPGLHLAVLGMGMEYCQMGNLQARGGGVVVGGRAHWSGLPAVARRARPPRLMVGSREEGQGRGAAQRHPQPAL